MTDYELVNGRGVVLGTAGDLDTAKKMLRRKAHLHEGLHVMAVERFEQRRVAYRPRPQAADNVTPFRAAAR